MRQLTRSHTEHHVLVVRSRPGIMLIPQHVVGMTNQSWCTLSWHKVTRPQIATAYLWAKKDERLLVSFVLGV